MSKNIFLSQKAIGVYGTILGIALTNAYSEIKSRNVDLNQRAVTEYKMRQFDPEAFMKMQLSIETMKDDIKEIKEILRSRKNIATY